MNKNKIKIISFMILVSFMISGSTSWAKTSQNKTSSKMISFPFVLNYPNNFKNTKFETFSINQNDTFIENNKPIAQNIITLPSITSATVVSSTTSVILNGKVNPNGQSTSAWFEIPSVESPIKEKLQLQKIGAGNSPVTLVPHNLKNLTPGTAYQFRIVASNKSGITTGDWITFKTLENINSELTLKSLNPSSGEQGETLEIDLMGTGFVSNNIDDLEVIFSGSGIDINSTIVNSDISTKINIDINPDASPGERIVTIKNSTGTSNAKTFTVLEAENGGGGGGGGGGGSSGSYIKRYVKVTTGNATNILKNSATLNGSVNPNKHTTTVWFEYGTTNNLLTFNETSHLDFGSFDYYSTLTQGITNLTPGTTYYFRAVGNNYAGTIRGNILSFTTAKDIPPIIPENNNDDVVIFNTDPIIDDYQINSEEQIVNNYDFMNNRNLVANPLFGFTKFLPSSIWGWLLFLIMTFLIIIIGRKLYQDYYLDKSMRKVNADHIENLPF